VTTVQLVLMMVCSWAAVTEQVTVALSVQSGVRSPSDTVTLSVTVPGAMRVNVGEALMASLSVPELAVQLYASAEGPWSESCAEAESAIVEPTATCAGFAEMPSAKGQTLITPLTCTLVVAVWHDKLSDATAV
jgi:hypothetical protein